MRGVVEVWRGDEKILEEPNMLVDGAGELLADIMTVSPSLSAIEDHATSSILDASNYMIQAMSFGTASEAFQKVGRDFYDQKQTAMTTVITAQRGGTLNTAMYKTVSNRSDTYQPNLGLYVEAPNPVYTVLSQNSDVSAAIPIPFPGGDRDIPVSSLYPGNGQHLNFMPSAIRNSITDSTIFDTSAEFVGNLMGSFPAGVSEKGTVVGAIYYIDPDNSVFETLTVGSYPNDASSMDVSGFLTTAMSSVPDATYSMSSTLSGLCLSAPVEETNEGFPFIEYSTTLSKDDVHSLNAFGGVYHLGLWGIDMEQSLLNGNTPPFAFSVLNNPRKYKLFCRKGLTKDLTYIDNRTQYADLTIKWRIHFR